MRAFAPLALVAVALLVASCATKPRPEEFRAVESFSGTVEWRAGESSGAARIRAETGEAGGFRVVVFDSAPRLAIERRGGSWAIVGSAIRGRWRGDESAVPARLEGWLSLAEACEGAVAAARDAGEVRTARFSMRFARQDGRLRTVELVTVATAQRFRATFGEASGRGVAGRPHESAMERHEQRADETP